MREQMKNESGIYPLGYRCLIQVPKKKEKDEKGFKTTDSGLVYQCEQEDREEAAQMLGTFICAGSVAFTGDAHTISWPSKSIPKEGAKVLFNKYAGGNRLPGMDGKEYALINDTELGAIVEEDYVG